MSLLEYLPVKMAPVEEEGEGAVETQALTLQYPCYNT